MLEGVESIPFLQPGVVPINGWLDRQLWKDFLGTVDLKIFKQLRDRPVVDEATMAHHCDRVAECDVAQVVNDIQYDPVAVAREPVH